MSIYIGPTGVPRRRWLSIADSTFARYREAVAAAYDSDIGSKYREYRMTPYIPHSAFEHRETVKDEICAEIAKRGDSGLKRFLFSSDFNAVFNPDECRLIYWVLNRLDFTMPNRAGKDIHSAYLAILKHCIDSNAYMFYLDGD